MYIRFLFIAACQGLSVFAAPIVQRDAYVMQAPPKPLKMNQEWWMNAVTQLPALGALAVDEDTTYIGIHLKTNSPGNVTVAVDIKGVRNCLVWRTQGDVVYDDCALHTDTELTFNVQCHQDAGTAKKSLICGIYHGYDCVGFGESGIVQQGQCDPANAQVRQLWQLTPPERDGDNRDEEQH